MTTMKLGTELTYWDRKHVLSAFVHRFTRENKPQWADATVYPVQFDSDADWLAHTQFKVRKNGRLDKRARSCMSFPTWPDNPELRK